VIAEAMRPFLRPQVSSPIQAPNSRRRLHSQDFHQRTQAAIYSNGGQCYIFGHRSLEPSIRQAGRVGADTG